MKGYDVHYSNKDFTQTIGGSLFNQELKGREKELFYYVYEALKYTLRSEQIYTSAIGSRHKYSSPYGRISVTIKGDNTFLVTAIDSWKEVNYIITLGDIDVDITNKEAQAPPLNTNN